MRSRGDYDYDITLPDGFVINNLDKVEPPMTWQMIWSTDKSHAEARPEILAVMRAAGFDIGDHLKKGLFIVSNEGHREWLGEDVEMAKYDGREFVAYTRHHAQYLWMQSIVKESSHG